MLSIIGIGPGSKEYILPKAVSVIHSCDFVIGFKRAMESIDFINTRQKIVSSLSEISKLINENTDKNIGIIASGDPCFYGITDYIKANYNGKLEIIPGLSSFQYLISKLNMSWQGAFASSLHGRETDFIQSVKSNKLSIWLTDNKNSPQKLCSDLAKESLNVEVFIGENLSYEDEKIYSGKPEEFIGFEFTNLCVLVVKALS